MSTLRPAHSVWLARRAAILEGTSPGAPDEVPDPSRAEVFHCIAGKVSRALEHGGDLTLTPEERTTLVTEARDLADRASRELDVGGRRDLERGEEWVRTARALREVVAAARA